MMNKKNNRIERDVRASEGKAARSDSRIFRFVNLLATDTLSSSYSVYRNYPIGK